MKNCLSLLLCLAMLFSLAACAENVELTEAGINNDAFSSENGSTQQKADAPYLKDTVKFTIPLSLIKESDRKDLDAYCSSHGYTSIKINEKKDTATIEMVEFSHQLMMTKIGLEVIDALYGTLEDGEYSYFKSIESFDEENFRSVVITVDREGYEADGTSSLLPYSLAQMCFMYQVYSQSNHYRCKVTVKDAKSGEVIYENKYKA